MSSCRIDGCDRRARYADGLCDGHYQRRSRGQDVTTPLLGPRGGIPPACAWTRLLSAALRMADVEPEEFNAAAEHLKRAAERYRRAHKKPNRKTEAAC
jgi:hypothetical protein